MNRQGSKQNPNGGIEWTHILGPDTGYTANPVRGCPHACRWRMPNGLVAKCYAEALVERRGLVDFSKPTWHPEVLARIEREGQPCGIFLCSMGDLFAEPVEDDWILKTLATVRRCPRHTFFLLTKNPNRLLEFNYPDNLWLGVSAPPTWINGKEMSVETQRVWFDKAVEWLSDTNAKNQWASLEPLSVDVCGAIRNPHTKVRWAVVGAASDGPKYYPPDDRLIVETVAACDERGIAVFFKGNMNSSRLACSMWRQQFPKAQP